MFIRISRKEKFIRFLASFMKMKKTSIFRFLIKMVLSCRIFLIGLVIGTRKKTYQRILIILGSKITDIYISFYFV